MAFSLAALGAGIGQFAQQYREQQESALRMLQAQRQTQLFEEEQRQRTQERAAQGAAFRVASQGGFGQQPIQGLPQAGGGGWPSGGAAAGPNMVPGGAVAGRGNRLPFGQLYQLALDAGFEPGEKARTAAAVSMAESGGNPGAINWDDPGGSFGLMQINAKAHGPDVARGGLDPATAFRESYRISRGGQDFSPWSVYKSGAYRRYLGEPILGGDAGTATDIAAGTGQFAMPTDAAAGLGAPRPTGPPDTLVAGGGAGTGPQQARPLTAADVTTSFGGPKTQKLPGGKLVSEDDYPYPYTGPGALPRPAAGQQITVPPATSTDYSRPPPAVAPPGAGRGDTRAFQPGAPGAPAAAAGPQAAQAAPPEPQAPIPPPTEQQLYQRALANEQARNPGADVPMSRRRLLAEAAKARAAGLQGQYKVENDRYKTEVDLWAKKQELAGSAEARGIQRGTLQETVRQNAASNAARYDEITQRIRDVDEHERAGTATRADLEDKSFLAHMKQKIEAKEQASQEEDRNLKRILDERRVKVAEQAQAGAAQRFGEKAAATKRKADTEMQLVRNLIHEAETLAQIVQSNPSVVGARGLVGRTVGGALEQVPGGQAVGSALGVGGPNYKVQTDFQNRLQTLQSKLSKELIQVRQFSGPAQARLNALLPGLAALEGPSSAAGALRNIASHLQQNLAAMETASGTLSEDVSKLTDEEILRSIGGAAPAAQP